METVLQFFDLAEIWHVTFGSERVSDEYPMYIIETTTDEFVILTTDMNKRDVWLMKVKIKVALNYNLIELKSNNEILLSLILNLLILHLGHRRWKVAR